jgi:hypothetical protein
VANQFGSFLVVVLVPAMLVTAILRLAGAKMTTALMWGSITMAVVAFLLWLTVGGVAH